MAKGNAGALKPGGGSSRLRIGRSPEQKVVQCPNGGTDMTGVAPLTGGPLSRAYLMRAPLGLTAGHVPPDWRKPT